MKKLLIVCSLALLSTGAFAQLKPHVGVGVGVGTTGIAIDASATLTPYLGARFGVDIMPKIKVSTDLDLGIDPATASKMDINKMREYVYGNGGSFDSPQPGSLNAALVAAGQSKIDLSPFPNEQIPTNIDVEGKLNNTTWHFLVDVYPFGDVSSFHITAGAYFGPKELISVYNKEDKFLSPLTQYNNALAYAQDQAPVYTTVGGNQIPTNVSAVVQDYDLKMIGAELGDYFITPDQSGNAKATIEVNGFRPYLGLGFGRAVPKGRLGCQFDLGVQFWGSPKIYAPSAAKDDNGNFVKNADGTLQVQRLQLTEENSGSDAGGVIKTISKVSVYPVLNFRLVGRIL